MALPETLTETIEQGPLCITDLFQNKISPKKTGFSPQKNTSQNKNHPKKLQTYGSWNFFFSAAPTAQNSPELHFHFINSFIQSSLLESLSGTQASYFINRPNCANICNTVYSWTPLFGQFSSGFIGCFWQFLTRN